MAFFQIKRIVEERVMLRYSEVSRAMSSKLPLGAFFTLAANPSKFDFKVDEVLPRWKDWPRRSGREQQTQRVDPRNWLNIQDWTRSWLSCTVGSAKPEEFREAEDRIIANISQRSDLLVHRHGDGDGINTNISQRSNLLWSPCVLVKISVQENDDLRDPLEPEE